jgi:hypothetical protein
MHHAVWGLSVRGLLSPTLRSLFRNILSTRLAGMTPANFSVTFSTATLGQVIYSDVYFHTQGDRATPRKRVTAEELRDRLRQDCVLPAELQAMALDMNERVVAKTARDEPSRLHASVLQELRVCAFPPPNGLVA